MNYFSKLKTQHDFELISGMMLSSKYHPDSRIPPSQITPKLGLKEFGRRPEESIENEDSDNEDASIF